MKTGATFSADRFYRYSLFRIWNDACPTLAFVLLNPSSADGMKDDPTIRRCMVRGLNGGFGGIEVVNLFAWRSTYEAGITAEPRKI